MGKAKVIKAKVAVYATALIDSADAVLLPSVFRALEREFHVGPSILGTISLCQSLAQSLSSPFWGYTADTSSRRRLLTLGCFIVALATIFVAVSQSITALSVFRMLTGFGLAAVGPIAQSVISDLVSPPKRGVAFGILGVTAGLGSICGTVFATSLSQTQVFGVSGWRFAFMAVAALAFMVGVLVWAITFDPKRGGMDLPKHNNNSNNNTETETEKTGLISGYDDTDSDVEEDDGSSDRAVPTFREWAVEILAFFKLKTFTFMVLQGLVGCIPWNAMVFVTLYLQYVGFDDVHASSLFSFILFGGMVGNFFGGVLGDAMARWSPNYGRVLTAQLSVVLGIPCVFILFLVIPRETSYSWAFALVLFTQGCVCTWCSSGCNRPILSEIVRPHSRSSVFALLVALEGSSGALGAPLVGVLAEDVFGYTQSEKSVAEMDPALRDANLHALATAAVVVMVVPWTLCFLLYGLMHMAYPHERLLLSRSDVAHGSARTASKVE